MDVSGEKRQDDDGIGRDPHSSTVLDAIVSPPSTTAYFFSMGLSGMTVVMSFINGGTYHNGTDFNASTALMILVRRRH